MGDWDHKLGVRFEGRGDGLVIILLGCGWECECEQGVWVTGPGSGSFYLRVGEMDK